MAHQHNQIRRHQRKKNHANHRTTAKHNQKPPTNSSGGNRPLPKTPAASDATKEATGVPHCHSGNSRSPESLLLIFLDS